MPSDAATALRDIELNIDLATQFVAGIDYEAFRDDTRTVYAVTRCLEIISEASRRLPDEMKADTRLSPGEHGRHCHGSRCSIAADKEAAWEAAAGRGPAPRDNAPHPNPPRLRRHRFPRLASAARPADHSRRPRIRRRRKSKAHPCTWPAPAAPMPAFTPSPRWPPSPSKTHPAAQPAQGHEPLAAALHPRALHHGGRARFSSPLPGLAKTYEYRIVRAEVCPPCEWRYVHHHPYPLSLDRMTPASHTGGRARLHRLRRIRQP